MLDALTQNSHWRALSCISLLFLNSIPSGVSSQSATAQSFISIVKTPSLRVGKLQTDEFFFDDPDAIMQSVFCLDTGGMLMPFRLTASLQDKSIRAGKLAKKVPYVVRWSDSVSSMRLQPDLAIATPVMHAESRNGCDNKILSVEVDQKKNKDVKITSNVDILTLTFIVE